MRDTWVFTRGAEALRDWMEESGAKQRDIAELIGAHQTRVSAILMGQPISLGAALKLEATGPKIPASWWLEEADEQPSRPPRKRAPRGVGAQRCTGDNP